MGFARRAARKSLRRATPRPVRQAMHPARTARNAVTPRPAQGMQHAATRQIGNEKSHGRCGFAEAAPIRFDDYLRSGGTGGFDRPIHVCNQISGAFLSKWKRYRRLKGEDRQHAHRTQNCLQLGAARNGQHIHQAALGRIAAERPHKAGDECIEVRWGDIDMGRIILRPHCNGCAMLAVALGPRSANRKRLDESGRNGNRYPYWKSSGSRCYRKEPDDGFRPFSGHVRRRAERIVRSNRRDARGPCPPSTRKPSEDCDFDFAILHFCLISPGACHRSAWRAARIRPTPRLKTAVARNAAPT